MNVKFNKYIALFLLTAGAMAGCSDDDSAMDLPRLFRPVAGLEASNNSIVASWDNIAEATNYTVTLCKETATDEAGNPVYSDLKTIECTSSPYIFANLDWDESYIVRIKCNNATKESKEYESDDVTINYPTKLTGTKMIDVAARVSWNEGGEVIKSLAAVPVEGGDTIFAKVSQTQYEAGYGDVDGLKANTAYNFFAYTDEVNHNPTTYAGRIQNKSTREPADFDALYGEGKWLDIRSCSDSTDVLLDAAMQAQWTEGMTIILKGDYEYEVNGGMSFDKSLRFATGMTLGGNATFNMTGSMNTKKGASVDKVAFEDINFISDQALKTPVKEMTKTGNYSRQVYNNNGNGSLNELSFKNCKISGFRAFVRMQTATDVIKKLNVEGCTIDGIMDQGVVTTNNKAVTIDEINFTNCTLTNIVTFCDTRTSAGTININLSNCTFCYAPVQTTGGNGNPLFRTGAKTILNIGKTVFGPAMATADASKTATSAALQAYTPATVGSVMLTGAAAVNVSSSYKTNFAWTPIGETAVTYPLEGLNNFDGTETDLFSDPSNGFFTIIGNIGESGIGSNQW